jgi:hypothetical protein
VIVGASDSSALSEWGISRRSAVSETAMIDAEPLIGKRGAKQTFQQLEARSWIDFGGELCPIILSKDEHHFLERK